MAYFGVGLDTTVQRLIFEFRSYTAKSNPQCSVAALK
jgi:hypothetical protein